MSRKKDLIRYTLRNERQLENCLRAIADEFIKRQSDKTAKPLQIIGNPERKKRTNPQSDIQFVWYTIAEQRGDMTASEYRALCKLIYFRRGNSSEIGDTQKLSRFLDRFEFFADDMGYGKFKNWCVNGIKPN